MCSRAKSSLQNHFYQEPERQYNRYYKFNEKQRYCGEFFRNSFHGEGSYRWNDKTVYEGGFYSNFKEGYGNLSFPDNSNFEGLFIMNKPFGPGIFTYANGRQDAGFWMGRKLVRLSRPVDFIIPRLAPSSAAKIKLLQFRQLIPLDKNSWDMELNSGADILRKLGYPFEHFYSPYSSLIYDPRSIFFDSLAFEKTYFVKSKNLKEEGENSVKDVEETQNDGFIKCFTPPYLPKDDYDYISGSDMCDYTSTEGEPELGILGTLTKFGNLHEDETIEDELEEEAEEYREVQEVREKERGAEDNSRPTMIVSWNRSELCVEILKQIFRYRNFEDNLTFNLGKLMIGARTAFGKTGVKEKECLTFLKLCSTGPSREVKNFLCSFEISHELMDGRGNNSLMFAASADHHAIIDILLNYGVDVNAFNDENLTPLNLCLLRRLAVANEIFNWEIAFLPKETQYDMESVKTQPWLVHGSIPSLDRAFGDGMSMSSGYQSRIPMESDSSFSFVSDPSNEFTMPQRSQNSLGKEVTNVKTSQRKLERTRRKTEASVMKRSFSSNEIEKVKPLHASDKTVSTKTERFHKKEEYKRSVKITKRDKYLFEFSFEKNPNLRLPTVTEELSNVELQKKREEEGEERDDSDDNNGSLVDVIDFGSEKKIKQIDKTIKQLLGRGANPNISEVPKPSIHLAIYTKDLQLIHTLLCYGANPDSQLYANEGLLTPLHVIVLQKPDPNYIEVCRMLLKFGADPNKETSPEFYISEEERALLDSIRGRNPLQLLCMRPDLEVVDTQGCLTQIALILAERTNRKCMYNGYSYLSLAMLNCNIKLLEALMQSKLFPPNEILQNDRGTALHVLVSRQLQRKNNYSGSFKMCNLLLQHGANPLITFKEPKTLQGNCVDYGYREIEAEREARKSIESYNSRNGKESRETYLQDHIKVVQYLDKKISEIYRKQKGRKEKRTSGKDQEKTAGKGIKKIRGGKNGEDNEKEEKRKEEKEGKTRKRDSSKSEENERKGKIRKRDASKSGEEERGGKESENQEVYEKETKDKKDASKKTENKGKGKNGNKDESKEREDEGDREGKNGKTKKGKGKNGNEDESKEREDEGDREGKNGITKKGKRKKGNEDESKEREDEGDREGKNGITKKGKRKKGNEDESKERENEGDREGKNGKTKKGKGKNGDKDESKEREDEGDREGKNGITKGKRKRGNEDESKERENEGDREGKNGKTKKGKGKNGDKDESKEREDEGDREGKNGITKKGKRKKGNEDESKEREDEEDREGKNGKTKKGKGEEKGAYNLGDKLKKIAEGEKIKDKKNMKDQIEGNKEIHKKENKDKTKIRKDNTKGMLDEKQNKGIESENKKRMIKESQGQSKKQLKPETPQSLHQKATENCPEKFPEKLRQGLLRVYGHCMNMDINELFVPYVVLRDGELYYKFQGNSKSHEQYSLI